MAGLAVFFLFIIACAVAPEAIINICRFVEAVLKFVFMVAGIAFCIGFWWWMIVR